MKIAILGRGAAGLSLVNNIQENQKKNFFLIDENKHKLPYLNKIPLLGGLAFRNSKFIEKINIETNGRLVPYFKSKVIGGATGINGCVATLGDIELWESLYKDYYDIKAPELKIPNGYNIKKYNSGKIEQKLKKIFDKETIYESSLYSDQESHGEVFITRNRITRSNLSDLKSNIYLKEDSIKKIIYYNDRVCLITQTGEILNFDKLILSAGVLGTIKLMSTCNDNYVGRNIIKDHPNIRIKLKLKDKYKKISLNIIEKNIFLKILMLLEYIILEKGLMQGPGGSYVVYKDFDNDGIVDTKIQILFFSESGRLGAVEDKYYFDDIPSISVSINLYKSGSNGVYDTKNDKIEFDYLGSKSEKIQLNNAIKFIHDLVNKTELKEIVDYIIDEDKFNDNYFKSIVCSGYHLISGHEKDNDWNLNRNLSVKDMNRIYCVDATSFPNFTASNISLPISLLAQNWIKTRNEFNF